MSTGVTDVTLNLSDLNKAKGRVSVSPVNCDPKQLTPLHCSLVPTNYKEIRSLAQIQPEAVPQMTS